MTDTNPPLITIGISCYNSADTVKRAVESALAQDWPNLEILIADDGSSDNTADIIRKTIEGRDNARLMVYDKNKGFAGSLNTIIAEAKGDFLAICDDDDISAPERIRKQYERIVNYERKAGTDKVICHAARTQIFPNGTSRYEPTMGTDETRALAPNGPDVADRILTGKLTPDVVGSCANCSRMARIGIFREMKGYDAAIRRAEDTDFNIRFAIAGGHFVGIAEPLVTQTMTLGAEKTFDREELAETYLLEKHKEYLTQTGWYNFCNKWLKARYKYMKNDYIGMALTLVFLGLRHPIKMCRKAMWIIPATSTRNSYKNWHHRKFDEQKAGQA